jgi:hypothetical protein
VDSEHTPTNAAILLPGHWTMVPSGHEGMTFRAISLASSSGLTDQDFGWDYDNLPHAFTPPWWFHLLMNANCRLGPDMQYPIVTSFVLGDRFEIGGVSQDGQWVYHELYRCFVARSTGEVRDNADNLFEGALDSLVVIPAPALPVTCSNYTDQRSCQAQSQYCEWYTPLGVQGQSYCRNR